MIHTKHADNNSKPIPRRELEKSLSMYGKIWSLARSKRVFIFKTHKKAKHHSADHVFKTFSNSFLKVSFSNNYENKPAIWTNVSVSSSCHCQVKCIKITNSTSLKTCYTKFTNKACQVNYRNTFACIESDYTLKVGLSSLINSIWCTRQSNYLYYFCLSSEH